VSSIAYSRVGRWVAAIAGVVLCGSLFLPWSRSAHANTVVLFGAGNRIGGFFDGGSKDASEVYSVADVCLAAVAVGIFAAAVIKRADIRPLILITMLPTLIFTVGQIFSLPAPSVFVGIPRTTGAHGLYNGFAVTAGIGETVGVVALAAAGLGLAVSFMARSE
jgi:hypothetical protein